MSNAKAFPADDSSFPGALRILRRRRLAMTLTLTAVVALGAAYLVSAPTLYRATTRLLIEKETPTAFDAHDVLPMDAFGVDYYQTQHKIIESRSIAEEVIRRLQLESHPDLVEPPGLLDRLGLAPWIVRLRERAAAILRLSPAGAVQAPVETPYEASLKALAQPPAVAPIRRGPRFDAAVKVFMRRTEVTLLRNSRLADVSFLASDPYLAATVANSIAQAYIDRSLQARIAASQEAVRWLRKSVQEEGAKVEAAERRLQRFKEEQRILTDFSTDSEQVTAQKLGELNAQVVQAETRRVAAQTRYERASQVRSGSLDALSEMLDSKYLIDLKNAEIETTRKLLDLQRRFGADYPKVLSTQADLRAIRDEASREIAKIKKSLQNEQEIALANERSLKDALAAFKQEAMSLGQNAAEFASLKRDVEGAREMHDLLLKRLRETSVAEDLKATNIQVVDAAAIPGLPAKPAKLPIMAAAFLGGLVCAVLLALARERLDNTLAGPEDLEATLGLPLLGTIPRFRPRAKDHLPEMVTQHSPRTAASEAFRGLRTNILFSAADKPPQVLLVTSPAPGEGKTLNAANLAATMAQTGASVLVLDCDLRRPKLHEILGVSREPGVSNLLAGGLAPEQVIQATAVPRLDVVPTGVIPPNPAELLSSRRMAEFIKEMRQRYDAIIVDSPPVTPVTDASVLATSADGVILVARSGHTTKDVARRALRQLQALNAKILGAVLNGVDDRQGAAARRYYGESERDLAVQAGERGKRSAA